MLLWLLKIVEIWRGNTFKGIADKTSPGELHELYRRNKHFCFASFTIWKHKCFTTNTLHYVMENTTHVIGYYISHWLTILLEKVPTSKVSLSTVWTMFIHCVYTDVYYILPHWQSQFLFGSVPTQGDASFGLRVLRHIRSLGHKKQIITLLEMYRENHHACACTIWP